MASSASTTSARTSSDQLIGDLSDAEVALITLFRGATVAEDFSVTVRRKNGRFTVAQRTGIVENIGFGSGDCFDDAWRAAVLIS